MVKFIRTSLVTMLWITLTACAVRTPSEPTISKATQSPTAKQPKPLDTPTQVPVSTPIRIPSETPTISPEKVPSSSMGVPIPIAPIREFLAKEMKVPVDQITLSAWKPVEWRDACLGIHTKGVMCATVITPGYTLKFQAGKAAVVVNTDATAKNYRIAVGAGEPNQLPALSWARSGGIAGICQVLTVYSLGNYYLWDCYQHQLLAQGVLRDNLQGSLSANTYLTGMLEEYSPFEWQTLPPTGSADMFSDQIRFNGNGSKSLLPEEQQLLSEYLAKLAAALEK